MRYPNGPTFSLPLDSINCLSRALGEDLSPAIIDSSDHDFDSNQFITRGTTFYFKDQKTFQLSSDLSTTLRTLHQVEQPFHQRSHSQTFTSDLEASKLIHNYLDFLKKVKSLEDLKSKIQELMNPRDGGLIYLLTDFRIWNMILGSLGSGFRENLDEFLSSNFKSLHLKTSLQVLLSLQNGSFPSLISQKEPSILASSLLSDLLYGLTSESVAIEKRLEEIVRCGGGEIEEGKIKEMMMGKNQASTNHLKTAKAVKIYRSRNADQTGENEDWEKEVVIEADVFISALKASSLRKLLENPKATSSIERTSSSTSTSKSSTFISFQWTLPSSTSDSSTNLLRHKLQSKLNQTLVFLPSPNTISEMDPNLPLNYFQDLTSFQDGAKDLAFQVQVQRSNDVSDSLDDSLPSFGLSTFVTLRFTDSSIDLDPTSSSDLSSAVLKALRSTLEERISLSLGLEIDQLREVLKDEVVRSETVFKIEEGGKEEDGFGILSEIRKVENEWRNDLK